MELKIDLSKEYGLVLEGGGAKGSYQIGAWKALKEAGVKIKGIAGSSVGSLNGALICMDNIEKAEYIWENISYSKVMDVDEGLIENIKNRDLKSFNLLALLNDAKKILKDRGVDITPLKELIEVSVDEAAIRSSGKELYITTYSISDREMVSVNVASDEVPHGAIGDMLLASAYFPVFKNEKLQGKRYLDGGGFDNVPTGILLEHGYQDIIIIRIYGLGFDSEKITQIPDEVSIYHIAPRQDLGGILEFDRKKARRNMLLGYYDAKRMLYGLSGRVYYIDAPQSEWYYFEKMVPESELLKRYLEKSEIEIEQNVQGCRAFTENLFPLIAEKLKLKEDWDYRELYVAMAEDMARYLHLNRFHIYVVDELVRKICMKGKSEHSKDGDQ